MIKKLNSFIKFSAYVVLTIVCLSTESQAGEGHQLTEALQALVADERVLRNESAIQTFFVSNVDKNDNVFIYWPENRMLMRLSGYDGPHPSWSELYDFADFTDLEEDVVLTVDEVGTSTFLETAQGIYVWLQESLDGCVVSISTQDTSVLGKMRVNSICSE